MAYIHIDHVSETVKMNMPLNMIVPDPVRMEGVPVRERKVLYLLHGLSDDASAWQRYTFIETLANAYGLVVVMPSAGRSFYTDQPNGQGYFLYLMEELPRYLADVFSLTPKREDTMIVGISMGGYGAFKAAFAYPERFSVAASFSGVLSLDILKMNPEDPRYEEFTCLFGDLEKLNGSEHDPAVWLQRAAVDPSVLPQLHIVCGRQDDLYLLSQLYAKAGASLGIKIAYHEEDGKHDWFFWNAQIQRFLESVLGKRD